MGERWSLHRYFILLVCPEIFLLGIAGVLMSSKGYMLSSKMEDRTRLVTCLIALTS